MPKLDGKGPMGQGSQTGCKSGNCSNASDEEKMLHPGKGMGKKRNSGGGEGNGKRFISGKL